MKDAPNFEWTTKNGEGGEFVVFPTTQGVAVYEDDLGNICIRQEAQGVDGDELIIVSRTQADQIANALLAVIAE